MSRRTRQKSIKGSFVLHLKDMRESPAWRFLPDHARRALDRLEIEHMRHGGTMNGRLPCTYSDFEQASIPRNAVAVAIRQCAASASSGSPLASARPRNSELRPFTS